MNRMLPHVLGSAALAVCLAQAAQAQCPSDLFWPAQGPENEPRYQIQWGGQIGGDHWGDGVCYDSTPVRCTNGLAHPPLNWDADCTAGRGVWSIDQNTWGANYGNMGSYAQVSTSGRVTFTAPLGVTEIPNVWMTFDIDASIDETDCCSSTTHRLAVAMWRGEYPRTPLFLDGGRLNHDAAGGGCGTGVFAEGVNFDGSNATFTRRVAVGPFTVPVGIPLDIGVGYYVNCWANASDRYFNVYHTAHVAFPTDAPVFTLPDDSYSADSTVFGIVDNWWSDPRVVVTDQPDDTTGCLGGTAQFSVAADGEGPIAYAWRKDGTELVNGPTPDGSIISGADTATLTISNAHGSDAGIYDCVVSNTYGPATSDAAALTFCEADFNCSGGTPDDADVAAFFEAWNLGDPMADVNASGGTPDDADVTYFFERWNAGC